TRPRSPVDGFTKIVRIYLRHEKTRDFSSIHHFGFFIDELDAIFDEEFERGDVLVGPHPDKIPITIPDLAVLVIRVVQINLIRRIDDPVFFLETCPAAQWDSSAAQHRVSANIMIGIDEDYGGAPIARHDRCGQTRGSRSDNDHIRCSVPLDSGLRRGIDFLASAGQTGRADSEGGALNEFSSAWIERVVFLGHVSVLVKW